MTQQVYLIKLSYSPIHDVTERIDHQVKSDIDGQGPLPGWCAETVVLTLLLKARVITLKI